MKLSPVQASISLTAAVASSSPIGTPICGKLAIRPRRLREPHSIASSTEPPHSPPTPRPCATRSSTSSTGARTPIEAYVGRQPIRNVPTPMRSSVATRVPLRPIRSPKWPKIAAPIGRAAKPTNWVPYESRMPANLDWSGKNRSGKTSAAAVP